MYDATAIKKPILALLTAAVCLVPMQAAAEEDDESRIPPLRDLPDFDATIPEEEPIPQPNQETISLIREGISLQTEVLETLRSIKDRESADAASEKLSRLAADLNRWGKTMDNRAQELGEEEEIVNEYEVNFLPTIRNISAEIRREGERLMTYGYFDSEKLKKALRELVIQTQ